MKTCKRIRTDRKLTGSPSETRDLNVSLKVRLNPTQAFGAEETVNRQAYAEYHDVGQDKRREEIERALNSMGKELFIRVGRPRAIN